VNVNDACFIRLLSFSLFRLFSFFFFGFLLFIFFVLYSLIGFLCSIFCTLLSILYFLSSPFFSVCLFPVYPCLLHLIHLSLFSFPYPFLSIPFPFLFFPIRAGRAEMQGFVSCWGIHRGPYKHGVRAENLHHPP
jgi:hypothetical protein